MKSTAEKDRFDELLGSVSSLILSLRSKNKELLRENVRLKQKLREVQRGQSDIFSAISESERITLKNQLTGLIRRIDSRLNE